MKYALLLSGIVELVGGIIVYFFPSLIFNISYNSVSVLNIYGLMASIIGIINIYGFLHFDENKFFRILFMCMMFFHGALSLILFRFSDKIITYALGATICHLSIFAFFVLSYLKAVKPDS